MAQLATEVPAEVTREDRARAAVSSTAIFVASLRAVESRKPPDERLVYDPLAEVLVGPKRLNVDWWPHTGLSKEFWVDFLAARTRWIDDRITAEAAALPELQLVIVGAGLDTRAYRLEGLRGKQIFELDFPEVLDSKLTILSEGSTLAEPLANRVAVPTDLSSGENWRGALRGAGFLPEQPSIWLLEGLTGYLTEEGLERLLADLSEFAAAGSRMIATFVGQGMRSNVTSMHRYMISDGNQASTLLAKHGWLADDVPRIKSIADSYGRSANIPEGYEYYIAEAVRQPTVAQSSPL